MQNNNGLSPPPRKRAMYGASVPTQTGAGYPSKRKCNGLSRNRASSDCLMTQKRRQKHKNATKIEYHWVLLTSFTQAGESNDGFPTSDVTGCHTRSGDSYGFASLRTSSTDSSGCSHLSTSDWLPRMTGIRSCSHSRALETRVVTIVYV